MNTEKDRKVEDLEYTLIGVMHSVDKWLEGDELTKDEVNRAITMREKTLQIIEKKQKEIEELKARIRENIKGEWIFKEVMIRSPLAENYYCSICKTNTARCSNFCPNCGADMRKVKK